MYDKILVHWYFYFDLIGQTFGLLYIMQPGTQCMQKGNTAENAYAMHSKIDVAHSNWVTYAPACDPPGDTQL